MTQTNDPVTYENTMTDLREPLPKCCTTYASSDDFVTEEDTGLDFDVTEKNVRIEGTPEQRKLMFADLAKYFEEVTNPENTVVNTFFKAKYAPLNEVLNTVRPILGKYGFAVIQIPTFDNANCSVNTILTHNGGGCISFPALQNKPTKPDVQGMGSTLTYLRRFSLNAYLGVMGEVDDDGNAASTDKGGKKQDQKEEVNEALDACVSYISKAITDEDKRSRNSAVIEIVKQFVASGKIKDVKDSDRAKVAEKIKELDK
jgi:hypothetical protein